MKKAARAEREKAKKEKMELERAARIQSSVSTNGLKPLPSSLLTLKHQLVMFPSSFHLSKLPIDR